MSGKEITKLVTGVITLSILLTVIILGVTLTVRIVSARMATPITTETLYKAMLFGDSTLYICLGKIEFTDKRILCIERDGTSWVLDQTEAVLIEVVR